MLPKCIYGNNYEIALIGAHNQSERLIPDGHMKEKRCHQKQNKNEQQKHSSHMHQVFRERAVRFSWW